jgi:fructokinase
MDFLWGIDLGGTKIEGAILEPKSEPEVRSRLRIPTEQEHGYRHIIDQIVRLVDMLREESGLDPARVGVGTPGIPLRMANDANCFAIAETKMGAVQREAPEAEVVFGVIMGTGVGGGIVIDGKVLNGKQGIAGEWGHIFLDKSGGPCYCGKIGCVETIISGPSLERHYRKKSGSSRRLPEIVERHKAGVDPQATQTVERLIHFFGKGLSSVINILDPDVIVLGGGLGNIDLLYSRGVSSVKEFVFNTRLDTRFLAPRLGDSAGVFGAALL